MKSAEGDILRVDRNGAHLLVAGGDQVAVAREKVARELPQLLRGAVAHLRRQHGAAPAACCESCSGQRDALGGAVGAAGVALAHRAMGRRVALPRTVWHHTSW